MKNFNQSSQGSISVEAALIVPIVIVTVITVIYIMLLIFQSCIMQITVNGVAESAAAAYYSNNASFDSGKISKADIASLNLYRRWGSNTFFQQSEFKADTLRILQKKSILKGQYSMDIQQEGIINKKITVVIKSNSDNPMADLMTSFQSNKNISLGVMATATIDDPAEFIRNSDFILENAMKVPAVKEFEGKWQSIINKIIDHIDKFTKEQ